MNSCPQFGARYYSQKCTGSYVFKTYFLCDLRLVLKNYLGKFPLLLNYERIYFFLKTSPKALWKLRFSFLFKCANILNSLGIHSPHILLKK
uniref:Putative ovule protein n=1 Tax=Solanum chacoense TaxID=4108 RepID=A0A0V0HJ29_SOLCH